MEVDRRGKEIFANFAVAYVFKSLHSLGESKTKIILKLILVAVLFTFHFSTTPSLNH